MDGATCGDRRSNRLKDSGSSYIAASRFCTQVYTGACRLYISYFVVRNRPRHSPQESRSPLKIRCVFRCTGRICAKPSYYPTIIFGKYPMTPIVLRTNHVCRNFFRIKAADDFRSILRANSDELRQRKVKRVTKVL